MTHPLDSAWAKLNRAHYHFDILGKQVTPYLNPELYRVDVEADPEHSKHRFRVKFLKPAPREDWALTIGDCVHNARSALDHAVWQIAELTTGPKPKDAKTQFPIFKDPNLFQKIGTDYLARLFPDAAAFVSRIQPCNRPNPDREALWFLQTLDIADKHKFLTPTIYTPSGFSFRFLKPSGYIVRPSGFVHRGPIEDNTVIAEIGAEIIGPVGGGQPPLEQVKVEMDGKMTVTIAFGNGIFEQDWVVLVFPILERVLRRVRSVLRGFDVLLQRQFHLPSSKG